MGSSRRIFAVPSGTGRQGTGRRRQRLPVGVRAPVQVAGRQQFGPVGRRVVRRLFDRLVHRHLSQSFDFQHLGRFEDVRQLVLGHVHLAVVHELDHHLQILEFHIFEDDYGMLARIYCEQRLELTHIYMIMNQIYLFM